MKLRIDFKQIIEHQFTPIVLAPLVLLSPLLLTGKALVWGTPSTQFFPWWDFAWRSLLVGDLPLWNPLLGMGAPLAANYQVGLFYPPYWIYLIIYSLGGLEWMAYAATWIVSFHLIWAGVGLAALLRELGMKPLAQTIGGLAFCLSGYLVARAGFLSINATAAWLPWVLLSTVKLALGRRNSFWSLSLTMAFLLLAGHAQTAWYTIILGAAWMLYWSLHAESAVSRLRRAFRKGAKYAGAALLGAGISAIQLLPTLEFLVNSQRAGEYGYTEAVTYSFWPWRLLTLFSPDLFGSPAQANYWGYGNYWEDAIYIGFLPILLAISLGVKAIAIACSRRTNSGKVERFAVFLAGMTLISFVLALGKNTQVFPFLYRYVPTFNLFQAPTRWSIWGVSSLAVLAGMGADRIKKLQGKKLYFARLAAAGCLAVAGGSILAWRLIRDLEVTFFSATAKAGLVGFLVVLILLLVPMQKSGKTYQLWKALAVLTVSLDLILAGWGLNPGIEKEFYIQRDKDGQVGRLWMPADLEYDLKFNHFFRFETFVPAVPWDTLTDAYLPNLPMLQNLEMVNNFDPLVPGNYQAWMDLLNAGELAPDILALMDVGGIITGEPGQIVVENYPLLKDSRVRVVGCAAAIENQGQALEAVFEGGGDYYYDVLLMTDKKPECRPGIRGKAEVLKNRNGYLKLAVSLDQEGWIFWSQTWYPGWRARIDDGGLVDVIPANYLFQAVPVPAGEHQVEFVYRPASYLWGGGVTALSLAVWVGGRTKIISKKTTHRPQVDSRS